MRQVPSSGIDGAESLYIYFLPTSFIFLLLSTFHFEIISNLQISYKNNTKHSCVPFTRWGSHIPFSCHMPWVSQIISSAFFFCFMTLTLWRVQGSCLVECPSSRVCLLLPPDRSQVLHFWHEHCRNDAPTSSVCCEEVHDVSLSHHWRWEFDLLVEVMTAGFLQCKVPFFPL